MTKNWMGVGTAALLMLLVVQAAWGDGAVTVQTNKQQYFCGEPVLLRTVVTNASPRQYIGHGFAWTANLIIEVAEGESGFMDIGRFRATEPGRPSGTPRGIGDWSDPYWLPGSLAASGQAQRTDMAFFTAPGKYRVRIVLKDGQDSTDPDLAVSEPVSLTVAGSDPQLEGLSSQDGKDLGISLGSSVFFAYYMQGQIWGGYGPQGSSLDEEEFRKVADEIIERHPQSVFRESVLFARMANAQGRRRNALDEVSWEGIALGERFVRKYPNSWLLPSVYLKLYKSYRYYKDEANAERVRKDALKRFPRAAILRQLAQPAPTP